MFYTFNFLLIIIFTLCLSFATAQNTPLICYQCNKTDDTLCSDEYLLPCHSSKNSCVTTLQKDDLNGYRIHRECGVEPCVFKDEMVKKGLGMDKCDTTKKDFFCIFCCKENGCNKNSLATTFRVSSTHFLLFIASSLLTIIM